MRLDFLNPNNPRYERKFCVDDLSCHELYAIVKHHRAMFSNIFQPRYVNNIYLDDHCLGNYWDNVTGSMSRLKVRIRWYGELFGMISKPVLELKMKEGLIGFKSSYLLPPFEIGSGFDREVVRSALKQAEIPESLLVELSIMEPSLLNRYRREYFMSADKRFRITIDTEMQFVKADQRMNAFLNRTKNHTDTVLELKYTPENDEHAAAITNVFPFRITRNSKYVCGVQALCLV